MPPNSSSSKPVKTGHRIAKLLARAGVASRREIERMIAEGRVALAGVPLTTPATVLASLDGVTVDGAPVEAPTAARLFLHHKPAGLLVTERDPGGRPTIYDRLPKDLPRLMPVGRLDLNTEGLLLLTTDGELKRQLELPATGVERAYRARAYGAVTQAQLEALIEGVEIEGVRYGSIDANLERRTGANVWIELILTEGKNREVRRVLEYLGLRVSRLIRTRYGPFLLGDLPVGGIGEVRAHDVASFRKNPTKLDLPQPARVRHSGPHPAEQRAPRPVPLGDPRPPRAKPAAARITRATASAADRAAFADAGPPRRTRNDPAREQVWSPRDSRPADDRAVAPAAKPKRFYDAKPKASTAPHEARPKRVFSAELGRNVRAKPEARPDRPPRDAKSAGPSSRPTRPGASNKPGGARPSRTRK